MKNQNSPSVNSKCSPMRSKLTHLERVAMQIRIQRRCRTSSIISRVWSFSSSLPRLCRRLSMTLRLRTLRMRLSTTALTQMTALWWSNDQYRTKYKFDKQSCKRISTKVSSLLRSSRNIASAKWKSIKRQAALIWMTSILKVIQYLTVARPLTGKRSKL